MASYTYDQGDFLASSSVDVGDLQTQVQNSAISSATLSYIDYEQNGSNFTVIIYFSNSLSGGDVTILNNLVATYVTTPPPVIEEVTVSTTAPAVITNKSLDTQTNYFIDLTDDTKKLAFDTASNTTNTTLTLASQTTANRTITFPDVSDEVVTLTATQTLTNKIITGGSFNGTGNTMENLSTFYVEPSSTAVSGSNSYYFSYFAQPSVTGSTTGSAYTIFIEGSPLGTITTPYAVYINGGKTYIGGSLQIPTGASAGYILQSDSVGNTSWAPPSMVSFADGTSALPGIAFSSQSSTGFYRVASGQIGVSLAGTEYIRFKTTGTDFFNGSIVNVGTSGTTSSLNVFGLITGNNGLTISSGTSALQAVTSTTLSTSGLYTANAGITVTNGQTLNVGTSGSTSSLNVYGMADFLGTGNSTASSATIYSNPASTSLTGASAFFFNYFEIPTTTVSTFTGTASTVYIAGPPSITTGGTGFALNVNSGTSRLQATTCTTLTASGQITSTVSTGTAPLVIASTTNVPNLNASSLNGATFAAPGPIGSTTASTGAFTTITASALITANLGLTIANNQTLNVGTSGTGNTVNVRGVTNQFGRLSCTSIGNTTLTSASVYIAPGSTAASGANNYFFTYLDQPATTGATTGSAYTFYIANAPSGTITNPFAFYVNAGKSYIGGALQIPTGASSGYVLTSDSSGNATWQATSGGSVTSVALTVPSFLSVSGSPITTSGTLDVTLSGTPLPILNGGTGSSTSTGTGSVVLQTSPNLTTPNIGAATGTSLSVSGNVNGGSLSLTGSTSGVISILPQAIAGTYNFNLPIASGSSGQVLTSGGGGSNPMTWSTPTNGTVTSVALTVPSFLSVTGSPITTSGTLAISVSSSTGSGALVLQTSPNLTTPNIGAASGLSLALSGNMNSASHTLTGATSGVISILPQAIAGTYNFNMPTSAGTAGQVLTSGGGGSNPMTWSSAGSGTVTSVALTVPSFLSVTGSPITTSGTLAVSLSGSALPILNGGTGSTTATGSGSVVLQTSPTLTTPNIGAATGTSLSVSGQLTSTVATGTPPLVVSSTTNVPNLNASSLSGATFASPGPIGSTTASTGAFTTISASGLISANAGLTVANSQTLNVGTSGTANIVNIRGTTNQFGQAVYTAVGSSTAANSTIYVNPASTALTGASTYYFTTFNAPTTTASTFTGIASTVSILGPPTVTTGGTGYALNITGNCLISNTNSTMGFFTNAIGGAGSWINLDTTGSSGIGTGGPGANALIAYASGAGNWFTNALAGDYCYRNGTGRILFGTSSGDADIILSTSGFAIDTKTSFLGTGSTTAASSAVYVAPSSTAITGANNYNFTYFAQPTTSGSTTGNAYTVYIQNAPSGTITNPYSLYINAGKTYIGGDLQIPIGATDKYVLRSDANGNASWNLPFLPDFSVNSTTSQTTSSTTAVNIPGMTLTPNIAGTYYVMFQAVARVTNANRTMNFQLALNGTLVTNSRATHNITQANMDISVFSSAVIAFNGTSDTVTAQYFVSANSVTAPNLKTIIAIRLDD